MVPSVDPIYDDNLVDPVMIDLRHNYLHAFDLIQRHDDKRGGHLVLWYKAIKQRSKSIIEAIPTWRSVEVN